MTKITLLKAVNLTIQNACIILLFNTVFIAIGGNVISEVILNLAIIFQSRRVQTKYKLVNFSGREVGNTYLVK